MAVITINSRSSFDEVCAEMDRRGAVIESLEAKLLAALSRAERAEASAAKMEAALRDIAEYHIPDQPAAYGGDELSWAQRQHAHLRRIARAALPPAPDAALNGEG